MIPKCVFLTGRRYLKRDFRKLLLSYQCIFLYFQIQTNQFTIDNVRDVRCFCSWSSVGSNFTKQDDSGTCAMKKEPPLSQWNINHSCNIPSSLVEGFPSLKRKQDQVLLSALHQCECYIFYVCSIKTKRSKSNVFLPMYPQPCHRWRVCKTPTWQKVPSGEEALPSLTLNNLSYLQIFWLLLICLLSESCCQTRQSQVVLFFIFTTHPPWTQDTKT